MNPLVLISLIKGAIEIFKSRKALKENLKSKTTATAAPLAILGYSTPDLAAALGLPADSSEVLVVQGVLYAISVGLFLYRKHEEG